MITVRRLVAAEAEAYRDFRLRALAAYPLAYGSTAEDEALRPMAFHLERIGAPGIPDAFMMGAFDKAGALIGTAGFFRRDRRSERHEGALIAMAVDHRWQGQGVGRRIVEALIAEARACVGLLQIELHVSEGNSRAIRLYESCGFKAYAVKPRATIIAGQPVSKVMMLLTLD